MGRKLRKAAPEMEVVSEPVLVDLSEGTGLSGFLKFLLFSEVF